MGALSIPEFKSTPIDDVTKKIAKLKNSFAEHKTRPVEFVFSSYASSTGGMFSPQLASKITKTESS